MFNIKKDLLAVWMSEINVGSHKAAESEPSVHTQLGTPTHPATGQGIWGGGGHSGNNTKCKEHTKETDKNRHCEIWQLFHLCIMTNTIWLDLHVSCKEKK